MADSYSSRRKSLERRQRLMDAMMGNVQAPGPGQMVGDHFVPTGLLGALTPAAQILAGGYAQGKMDEESKALDQERTQILRNALEKSKTQEAGDRIQTLMGSEVPELQQMGMKLFEQQIAPPKPEKFKGLTVVRGPDGKPMLVQAGDQGNIKKVEGMMPFERPMAVRGELINPLTLESYGMFGQAPAGTTVNVTNNMPAQSDVGAFVKNMGKNDAQHYTDLEAQIPQYDNMDQYLNQQKELLRSGAVTGGFAPTFAAINNALQTFGISLSPELENTKLMTNREDAMKAGLLSGPGAARLTDKDMGVFSSAIEVARQGNPAKALQIMQQWNNDQRRLNKLQRQRIEKKYPQAAEYFKNASMGEEAAPTNPVSGMDTGASQGPVQITDDAAYDKLPSGSTFVGPDGKLRRKP